MRKLLLSISLLVALGSSALANWTGKDATPATITFYNPAVCTSVVCTPVMQLTDGTNQVTLTTAGADAVSNTLTGLPTYSRNLIWNGTTWDRQASGTALGSILVNNGVAANFLSTATLNQGGSALSATNGIFANILQGNAVISNTNPSFMSVTDGTTKVVVKAASTAAAAADSAFVVAISPNNVIPVKTASGAIASGSYSSGAFASGAYASGSIGAGAVAAGAYVSGSVLSGAYASGSLASGAVVDLTNLSGTTAAAVPAKAAYLGMNVGGNIVGIVGKAASTAAVATDSSTVTNESPNSQLSTAVGTTADAPCTLPATTTTCSEIAVQKAIANAANSAVPLGSASGGMSIKTLPGLTNTAGGTAVKASAGQVFKVQCYNPDATNSALIELFNTASVTLGTTVPFDFVEIGPGQNAGFTYSLVGEQFTTAIQAAGVKTYNTATAPTTAIDCTVAFN